eukprot:4353226-Lingulodinium_polyedra.AAC.1
MPKPGAKEIEAVREDPGDPEEGPPPLVDEDGLPAPPSSGRGQRGNEGAGPVDGGAFRQVCRPPEPEVGFSPG